MFSGLRLKIVAMLTACVCLSQQAAADGYFIQLDVGGQTQGLVAAASQGPVGYGVNVTEYEGGRSGAASISYGWSTADIGVLKLGPTIGFDRADSQETDVQTGIKASLERYSPATFGSTFVLADVSSVNRSWFLLGQLSHQPTGVSMELSRGGSDTYHETTLAVQGRLSDGPLILRLGYKLSSDELFAGIAINTF